MHLGGSLATDHLQGHSTLEQGPSSAPMGTAYSSNSPISPPLPELTWIKPHLQRTTEFCRKGNLWSWWGALIHPHDTEMFFSAAGVMQGYAYITELWNFNRHLLYGVQVRRDVPWWDAKQNDSLNGWINAPPALGREVVTGKLVWASWLAGVSDDCSTPCKTSQLFTTKLSKDIQETFVNAVNKNTKEQNLTWQ